MTKPGDRHASSFIKPNDVQLSDGSEACRNTHHKPPSQRRGDRGTLRRRRSRAIAARAYARLREEIEKRQADARTQRLAELVSVRIRDGRSGAFERQRQVLARPKVAGDSRRTTTRARLKTIPGARQGFAPRTGRGVRAWLARRGRWCPARISSLQREVWDPRPRRRLAPDADRNAKLVQNASRRASLTAQTVRFSLQRAAQRRGAAVAAGALSARLRTQLQRSPRAARRRGASRLRACARLNLQDVQEARGPRVLAPAAPVQVTAWTAEAHALRLPEYRRRRSPRPAARCGLAHHRCGRAGQGCDRANPGRRVR
jgi:hypothetical protein